MDLESIKYSEIYTALSQDRIIFLSEDLTKEVASTLCGLLLYYNSLNPEEDIHLFINTCGGDASALACIYDVISLIQAPVSTIGIGRMYSAGAFILAAGRKGKRFMFKNAEVMIHGLQCSFPQTPEANPAEATNYYNYLHSFNKKILKILAKHTERSVSQVTEDAKRDFYMDAKMALKYGIIDKIL